MKTAHYLFMAGGTGGHVFPALAVAQELMHRGAKVSWLGTSTHIESKVIPAANIPLYTLTIKGVRGKRWLSRLSAPFILMVAIWQALTIFLKIKPSVVIGFGGFVSAPGGLAAKLLHKKLIVHEQNAVAGSTNKLLARLANKRLEAFRGSLANALWTGNPVRNDIVELHQTSSQASTSKKGLSTPKKLLIIGGSLGAQALNEMVPASLALVPASLRPEVWHQTGKGKQIGVDALYTNNDIHARVAEFIDDMATAYGWADLIICRSGAMTVSEVSIAGLPAIFIPYPHAIDDHQSRNAERMVSHGAALVQQQSELTAERLAKILTPLLQDDKRLIRMGEIARQLSLPGATVQIADICEEIACAN